MRLQDLTKQLKPNCVFVREPAEGAEEPDLVAFVDGDPGFSIAIEIKWSHNAKCVSSVTDQLGVRYLVRSQRTRGLHLTGFSGFGSEKDKGALEKKLKEAAESFEGDHPEVRIDVRVLDMYLPKAK